MAIYCLDKKISKTRITKNHKERQEERTGKNMGLELLASSLPLSLV